METIAQSILIIGIVAIVAGFFLWKKLDRYQKSRGHKADPLLG